MTFKTVAELAENRRKIIQYPCAAVGNLKPGVTMLTRTVFGRTYTYSHCVGRSADGGLGFTYPVDLSFAPGHVVYVLSRSREFNPSMRVTKCSLGVEPGQEEFIFEFGSYGSGDLQFMQPTSIAVDKDENVYVSDEALTRISIFDSEGNFLDKWGTPGSGDGELDRPWGLTFDRQDDLWVVDSGNNRIQKFTKDGKFLAKWGKEGSGEGEFNMPWGITLDDEGDVYVADWANSRVQKLTPEGRYLMSFGAPGSGQGEMRRPSGVAVDEEGDVYVVDWGNSQVHAYGPDGSYLTTFIGDAQQPSKWAQMTIDANPDIQRARRRVKSLEPEWRFWYPTQVEIDEMRRIFITDPQRSRLQIYIKEKDYVDPQFNL